MCTVTWQRSSHGYQLFCNRDERRTRQPALSPRRFSRNNLRCLAPIDGECGGSWIGVNEHALTVCVLNGTDHRPSEPVKSRGHLVPEALGCGSFTEIRAMLRSAGLQRYRSFTLLVISISGDARAFAWNGYSIQELSNAEQLQPFTSSSFAPDEVIPQRVKLFHTSHLRGEMFHSSHAGGPGPHSVCMHRQDAETVSFTKVSVSHTGIALLYSPQSPCAGIRGEEVSIQ